MTMPLLANIDVDDVEKAIDFYCRALDLRVGRRLGPDFVELLGGSSPIYLLQKPAGSRAAEGTEIRRDYARHWTPVHLDFVVGDAEAAVTRALAAGARSEGGLRTRSWGRLAVMSDPFGHGFCLIEFTGRGYDALVTQPPEGTSS